MYVNLSEDMIARIDAYARDIGVSRNGLVATLLGQSVSAYENSKDVVQALYKKLEEPEFVASLLESKK